MKFPSISLLTWALNEEENLLDFYRSAVKLLKSLSDDYEIIFINDGSTDDTEKIALEISEQDQSFKYFSNSQNLGVGNSLKKALSLATKDYIFWQTVDWSYDIEQFINLDIEPNHNLIVHGARELSIFSSLKNMQTRSDNNWKGFISLVNFIFIRLIFTLPFHDVQNVTVYPQDFIKRTNLLTSSSFTSPELLIRAYDSGFDFLEVRIPFLPRKHGIANGTRAGAILSALYQIITFRLAYRKSKSGRTKSRFCIANH